MVELGNSAKQQKANRFEQIKKEVNEMVRARVSQLKSQVIVNYWACKFLRLHTIDRSITSNNWD